MTSKKQLLHCDNHIVQAICAAAGRVTNLYILSAVSLSVCLCVCLSVCSGKNSRFRRQILSILSSKDSKFYSRGSINFPASPLRGSLSISDLCTISSALPPVWISSTLHVSMTHARLPFFPSCTAAARGRGLYMGSLANNTICSVAQR